MNILVDAHLLDGFFQGTRSYIEGLYRSVFAIEERNPSGRIYYLAAKDMDTLKRTFPEKPFIKYIQLKSTRSYQRLLFEFPAIIRKYKIDYAHFQYIIPFAGKCRYIITIHDLIFMDMPEHFSWYYKNVRKWLFRRSYKKASFVFTDSKYSQESIFKFYGKDKPVTIVPVALEDKIIDFVPKYTGEQWRDMQKLRKYILYVSRFEQRKNHYNLLLAFLEGKLYEKHDLVLIGKKSEQCKAFEELYATLPEEVKKAVLLMTEGVALNDLFEFMKHASVFIYPSLAEGFGIPPLEAAVLRTPVICSNTTSLKEFVFFGDDHIDCSTPGNISNALHKKLGQPGSLLNERCENIRGSVLSAYNWNRSATIFLGTVFTKI